MQAGSVYHAGNAMTDEYKVPETKCEIAREVWRLTDSLPEGSHARFVVGEIAEWLGDGCCYDLQAEAVQ